MFFSSSSKRFEPISHWFHCGMAHFEATTPCWTPAPSLPGLPRLVKIGCSACWTVGCGRMRRGVGHLEPSYGGLLSLYCHYCYCNTVYCTTIIVKDIKGRSKMSRDIFNFQGRVEHVCPFLHRKALKHRSSNILRNIPILKGSAKGKRREGTGTTSSHTDVVFHTKTQHLEGFEAKVISFSTVIHAFARKGDATSAAAWQEKMLDMGVQPATWIHRGVS